MGGCSCLEESRVSDAPPVQCEALLNLAVLTKRRNRYSITRLYMKIRPSEPEPHSNVTAQHTRANMKDHTTR